MHASSVCHSDSRSVVMRNDIEFNIQFVKTVENYQNLWNSSLESYSNRVESEKSWRAIGEIFGESPEACQEKWRILRGSFSRSFKHKMEGNTNRKEYYLSRHMQFLVPHMKTNKKPKTSVTSQEVEVLPDQYMTFKFEDTEDYQSDTASQLDTNGMFEESTGDTTKDSFEHLNADANANSKKKKRRTNSKNEDSDDSDLLFLKSIIPEMKALEGKKKNIFKVKVLNTLAELLYCSDDSNPTTSSSGEAFKNCTDSGLIYTKL